MNDGSDSGEASSLARAHDGMGSWGVLTAMVVIGSSTATAAKFAVAELPVSLLPIVRFGGAGLVLLPLVLGRGVLVPLLRKDWRWVLAGALLCVPINQGFFLNGTRLAPTTHVGFIYATCPIVVLALAVLMRQERLERGRVIGIVVTVAGAALIAFGSLRQPGGAGSQTLRGDLLLVGAVVSWGGYLAVNKRLLGKHPALAVLAATFLIGALLCIPAALLTIRDWPEVMAAARPRAWWGLVYLTLVASLMGLALQNVALRRFDASHVAAVGNLSPVLTVLWGIWLLKEDPSPLLVVGGLLTLGGVIWTSRGRPVSIAPVVGSPSPRPPGGACARAQFCAPGESAGI
jgi:drug/metabolite transporter (DMT)-like permease